MKLRPPRLRSVFTTCVMIFLYAPIVTVIVYSVNKDPLLIHWEGFTTEWYRQAFNDPTVRQDVITTLKVAALSTAISLFIAVTAALWARGQEPEDAQLVTAKTASKSKGRDVFVYFDNDKKVLSPVNAQGLMKRVDKLLGTTRREN